MCEASSFAQRLVYMVFFEMPFHVDDGQIFGQLQNRPGIAAREQYETRGDSE